MLEVVDHEEEFAISDGSCEAVLGPQRLCDLRGDERRVPDGRQPHPEDAVAELRHELGRRLDRESRLARPAGARQREQTSAALEQLEHVSLLLVSSDERARRTRQIRVRDRPQGWETIRPELEEPDGLVEVLEPMLPEVQ